MVREGFLNTQAGSDDRGSAFNRLSSDHTISVDMWVSIIYMACHVVLGRNNSPPISGSQSLMRGAGLGGSGVDGSTGEAIPIDVAPSLRRADDPYRADVVRWAALDVPLIIVEKDSTKLREAYRIPADIELILPGPNERACFLRRGCIALHLNAFVSGMCLPFHPMLRRILRAYDLASTQVTSNGWSQIVEAEEVTEEERQGGGSRVVLLLSLGSHKPLVTGCPSSIKQWKESWFWVSGNWQRVFDDPEPDLDIPSVYRIANSLPRCELSRDIVDVLRSIYQVDQKTRSYGLILNRHRCLVELSLMASKDTSQRKAIEDLSKEENKEAVEASKVIDVDDAPKGEVPLSRKRKRTLVVNTSREVVLEGPSRSVQTPGDRDGGPYDLKRRLRELIGAPGARIPDDALRNLSFYPSMGAQAVKKYFTPKWEEFSSHGELEDVLEASLASAIRASAMQLKLLEHKQALEGLQASLDRARTAYEQMEADLKESDSNVFNLTKQLDNANAAQKVTAEVLEATNKDKRRLLDEAKSHDEEI
ncbi:Uncharacterized protein Adt_25093 [Abeliophyllum distichum]|uniref:Uncharacterized protein n=1 Tax=Abeliophyllum distichum TaxID=126358 RepID=A0ABD1SGN9_9LAMI